MEVVTDPTAAFASFGATRAVPLSRMQKVVAKRLLDAWSSIPHVTHFDEADISDLEAIRKTAPADERVSPLVHVIRAVASALRAFPQFNASLSDDGKHLILKDYVHIGIAVETAAGLLVPVLRDCDKKTLSELSVELADVSVRARERGLGYDEMVGGCFTISSLGGIGGTGFSPIVNPPEVAILGLSRASVRPSWSGEAFVPRTMLPFSLSYDHRVINGADAARFCRFIADVLGRS